jgi:hypothetical protein
MELGGGSVVICLLFLCVLPEAPPPVTVNNFAQECRVYTISKRDTPETQRNLARENGRCRDARAKQQKK